VEGTSLGVHEFLSVVVTTDTLSSIIYPSSQVDVYTTNSFIYNSRVFDDSLAPLGVRASQLTVLALIGAIEGLRATDVARYLKMDKSTVSRGLVLLRARGWVEESAGPSRKAHRLDVTAEGRALLRETLPLWRSAVQKARGALGEESVEALQGAADSFLRLRASR
jgi:DNA-binding MarR family transcriptional regulator